MVCAFILCNLYQHNLSCNLTPPISRVLIGPHLVFYSLTSPPCCNSPRKCTQDKKLGSQLSHRQPLPVWCLLNPYLKECLTFEVTMSNKRGYVVSIYWSPSQNFDNFNSFSTNLEKLVINMSSSNLNFILMIGDFHAKSRNWSYNDTTTAEGAQLDYLTSLCGLKQVITESTHILEQFL